MKIILDNDATVTDYEKFIDRYAIPYFCNRYGFKIINPDALEIEDIFNLSACASDRQIKKMLDSFWISYRFVQYTLLSRFRPGAATIIRRFIRQYHNVEIHTSRAKTCEHGIVGTLARMFTIWQYWLNGVFLSPSKFHFYKNDEDKFDLSFLKNPVCGGDKIAPPEVEKINQYLISHNANRLKIGYGASEFGGGIVITTDNGPYDNKSTGEILPGVVGMVIDPDTGKELKYNESGELCFSSPTMMCGYLHNEEETNNIIINKGSFKYYRTGDKGYINENGCVYVVDRYKRAMMRPDGHTVHATPIENVIMEHNAVEACAVVGLPLDSNAGVIPTAFIKLKDQSLIHTKIVDEIDMLCTRKIPERDKALAYAIIDSFPYTLMGKVDYRALEKYCFSEVDCIIKDHTFLK